MNHIITTRYGEIALKGENRADFERMLIRNIKKALEGEEYEKIELTQMRILIYLGPDAHAERIAQKLKAVFGIDWFGVGIQCERDVEAIKRTVAEHMGNDISKTIKVETNRADKRFKLTSMEVDREVGTVLYEAGFKISLKNPQRTVYVEILNESANVFFDKVKGAGGLPVGTSGKVLCLMSGGIDSPVAAWSMMKRGCIVDYLHIHPFGKNESVEESKIPKIIDVLDTYSQRKSKLFLVPHGEFYKKTFSMNTRSELVLFRRFILRLANEIAKKEGYLGIVTGDNIAQVASQTLENLYATNTASELPVYRPLLTYNKSEIIENARAIGTYELSLQEYKDCCSLVAMKHPTTRAKKEEVESIEKEIEIEGVVMRAVAQATII